MTDSNILDFLQVIPHFPQKKDLALIIFIWRLDPSRKRLWKISGINIKGYQPVGLVLSFQMQVL
jgi:hypothetical protein